MTKTGISTRHPRPPWPKPSRRTGREIEEANGIYAAASLDDIERRDRASYSLRWILVHLIEEYARHCGHADLIRQAIDGATGD